MNNNTKFRLSILAASLVVLAAVIAGNQLWNRRPLNDSAGPIAESSAVIVVDNGAARLEYRVPAAGTVFSATRDALQMNKIVFEYKEYPGMGVLVTQIGGVANGTGGAYWQYWLNGQYAEKAADQTELKAGDKIDWKFSSSSAQ